MSDYEFIKITKECPSMTLAAKLTGMSYNSFKRKAISLQVWNPNQSKKGRKFGHIRHDRFKTEDILAGKHPQYGTFKLKRRLIEEGIKEDKCERCGWCEKVEGEEFTPCELHHINGNPTDHHLENLIILCPNCHSLTESYRFRRGRTNESLGKKFLDEKVSNSVKPDDKGNTEPSQ